MPSDMLNSTQTETINTHQQYVHILLYIYHVINLIQQQHCNFFGLYLYQIMLNKFNFNFLNIKTVIVDTTANMIFTNLLLMLSKAIGTVPDFLYILCPVLCSLYQYPQCVACILDISTTLPFIYTKRSTVFFLLEI